MCLNWKGSTVYQLAYLKIPLMSTSLTAAFRIGSLTSAAPIPTSTSVPPLFVDCGGGKGGGRGKGRGEGGREAGR